jgi:hypothetical protein
MIFPTIPGLYTLLLIILLTADSCRMMKKATKMKEKNAVSEILVLFLYDTNGGKSGTKQWRSLENN